MMQALEQVEASLCFTRSVGNSQWSPGPMSIPRVNANQPFMALLEIIPALGGNPGDKGMTASTRSAAFHALELGCASGVAGIVGTMLPRLLAMRCPGLVFEDKVRQM